MSRQWYRRLILYFTFDMQKPFTVFLYVGRPL